MSEVHQHWYETARYQEVAASQWYLQMKWLDMKPGDNNGRMGKV